MTRTAVVLRTSLWGTIFRIVRKLAWIFSICIRGIMISPSTVTFWKDLESQPLQELLFSRNAYISNLPAPCFVGPFSSPFSVDEQVRLCLQCTGCSRIRTPESGLDQAREGEDGCWGLSQGPPSPPSSSSSANTPSVLVMCMCCARWANPDGSHGLYFWSVCRRRGALHGAYLGTVRIVQGGGNPSGVGAQFERQLPWRSQDSTFWEEWTRRRPQGLGRRKIGKKAGYCVVGKVPVRQFLPSDAARLLPDARARPSSAPSVFVTSAVIHSAMSVGPQACLTRHHCNLKFYFTHQHLKTRVCLVSSLGFPCSQGLSGRTGSLF